jgi:phosphoribosylformylglycinamidine synthase
MVSKIPVLHGETDTVSMMSYGFNPEIGKWSPFHGGYYAVVESVAKLVASGASYKKIRVSLQEYFERLGADPKKWGKPFAALLGASHAQSAFGIAAIGGKDSMSGSFKDLGVPPTLISFAVSTNQADCVITPELKKSGSKVYMWYAKRLTDDLLEFDSLLYGYSKIHKAIAAGDILSAYAVGKGGALAAVTKMAFGNEIGVDFNSKFEAMLKEEAYGSIVFELASGKEAIFEEMAWCFEIGKTIEKASIGFEDKRYAIRDLIETWEKPLKPIFPTVHEGEGYAKAFEYKKRSQHKPSISIAKPRVLVPVFPGTNCEYDTAKAFEKAGAKVETFVFRNRTQSDLMDSIEALSKLLDQSEILALPGGFSAGDEPEGSGKFMASVLRNPKVAESVMRLLQSRDGLILGICNGFQALVKTGLLPYGEIRSLEPDAPTLTFNKIGRHVAKMGNVRVSSVMSPWFSGVQVGDVFKTAFSHGEGRFYANVDAIEAMAHKGQIATQYVDASGRPTYDGAYNLNGSVEAIEGLTSADGRILGKMGHVERMGDHLYKNISGEKYFNLFTSGVQYYK